MKKVELLDFLAPWCTHCHNMTPSIDFLIEQYKDDENVLIRKIDVDVNPEIAKNYGIRGIPALVFLKDGEEVYRVSGVQTKEKISSKIQEIIEN